MKIKTHKQKQEAMLTSFLQMHHMVIKVFSEQDITAQKQVHQQQQFQEILLKK